MRQMEFKMERTGLLEVGDAADFLLLYTWKCICNVSKLYLPGTPEVYRRDGSRCKGNTEGLFCDGRI